MDTDSGAMRRTASLADGTLHSGGPMKPLLLASDAGLYALALDGTAEPVAIWDECGIAPSTLRAAAALDDGSYFLRGQNSLYRLRPAAPDEQPAKTKLVLAALGNARGVQASAERFNQSSELYYVQVRDYTQGGALDAAQARQKLHTDLIAGKGPDMLLFAFGLSPYAYIRKGFLTDLSGFLDTDGQIGRADIAVLPALETAGGVYFLSDSFVAETLLGLESTFGDARGWTLADYLQLENARPAGAETLYNTTREGFLERLAARYIPTAINWADGSCRFDSAEFIHILSAAARIRENPEGGTLGTMDFTYGPVRVAKGTLLASACYVDSVWKLAYEEAMAGCALRAIGWPTPDGSCGSDVYLSAPIGICSQSQNADGSWAFLKFCLLELPADSRGIPMYLPTLQKRLEDAKKETEGQFSITEADAEAFLGFLSGIENAVLYDETVLGIIRAESAAFFAGDRTAEETAGLIQSKVRLYVAEQN